MKTFIVCLGCFTASLATATAQKIKYSAVPAPVKAAFDKLYSGKTASWEKEKENFEAGLKADGTPLSLLFSPGGQLLETETPVAVKSLPVTVLAYVHKRYPGAVVREGAKIVKPDGSLTYEAEVKGKDLIFSQAGEYLRRTED